MNYNEKYKLKVILLGDSNVGKSSLINRYVNKKFTEGTKITIGNEFYSKPINIDGCIVHLMVSQKKFN